jgi:DNA-binding YbaB/EbfC family protein
MADDGMKLDMGNLMKVAQEMQASMERAQGELTDITGEGAAGGGMVKATANGQGQLLTVAIDREVVDPEDVGMLQDLMVAAVNQAIANAREKAKERMAQVTGGMNIPGISSLL